jgi:hypothetical protein
MTCCKKPLCEECSDAHDCSHGKRVTRNSKKDTSKFVDFSAVEIDGDSEEEEDKEEVGLIPYRKSFSFPI